MKSFGVSVTNNNYQEYFVAGGQAYAKDTYFVEPDATGASYFWGIAALTKNRIKILHLSPKSMQGDVKFADILGKMGCVVRKNVEEQWVEVEGSGILRGLSVDMKDMPDTVQTLAVIAAFAQGRTVITGLGNLKVKETDRIEAPRRELKKMGVNVESSDNSLTINGNRPHGADIDTYGDHRMAMAFSIAGAKIPGVVINDSEVVSKSFPGFWKKLEEVGVRLETL
jgi:3-phosphoshikimate 1-carboxyvinyltransferase